MLINIDKLINNHEIIYAHKKENVYETLKEHSDLVLSYFEQYYNILDNIVSDFNFCDETKNIVIEAFKDAIYGHDLGKSSPYFQCIKMKNKHFKNFKDYPSCHSILSAIMYISIYEEYINENIVDDNEYNQVKYIIYAFAFIISRHHSGLKNYSISDFMSQMKEYIESEGQYFENFINSQQIENIYLSDDNSIFNKIDNKKILYLLCKFLHGSIVYCDFLATSEYMTGKKLTSNINDRTFSLIDKYENTDLIKNIRKKDNHTKLSDINKVRTEIFLETESNFLSNMDKRFFYMKAPCGAGKTNCLLNIAFQCIKNNDSIKNPFFIFPFNTLIEQTGDVVGTFATEYDDYIKINSITSIYNDDENIDYEQIYLDYQFINYPLLMTSHVYFFDILFGTGRKSSMLIPAICNSVIILDEIQAYRNEIWREIIESLNMYSKYLNIKFIISSATLPKLDNLMNYDNEYFYDLLPNCDKYFSNPVFKNRVNYNYDLLKIDKDLIFDEIKKIINDNPKRKILIEFIKKKSANIFYEEIKELFENVCIVTGDTSKLQKKEIIQLSKETTQMILVSTQVIEAGADIDFDIGIKDISIIDSEEQFSGRINRNNKKNGIVYLFNYDDAKKIYIKDFRINYNLLDKKMQDILREKQFDEYYNKVLEDIYENTNKYNNDNINSYYNKLKNLQFQDVNLKMRLINSDNITIYLMTDKKAEELYEAYKSLITNKEITYAEKQIKLSMIKSKMDNYMLNIMQYTLKDYNIIDNTFGFFVATTQNDIYL